MQPHHHHGGGHDHPQGQPAHRATRHQDGGSHQRCYGEAEDHDDRIGQVGRESGLPRPVHAAAVHHPQPQPAKHLRERGRAGYAVQGLGVAQHVAADPAGGHRGDEPVERDRRGEQPAPQRRQGHPGRRRSLREHVPEHRRDVDELEQGHHTGVHPAHDDEGQGERGRPAPPVGPEGPDEEEDLPGQERIGQKDRQGVAGDHRVRVRDIEEADEHSSDAARRQVRDLGVQPGGAPRRHRQQQEVQDPDAEGRIGAERLHGSDKSGHGCEPDVEVGEAQLLGVDPAGQQVGRRPPRREIDLRLDVRVKTPRLFSRTTSAKTSQRSATHNP